MPADATLNTLATFIPPELDYLPSLKALLHPLFYLDDVPEAVIQADEARGTHLPTGIMKTLCNVSDVRQLARKIAVPLFLANGDRDVSPDFASEPKAYEQATDITLFTVSGSAHCHNLASSRFALWNRLATWIMEQCRLAPDAEFQKTHVLSR